MKIIQNICMGKKYLIVDWTLGIDDNSPDSESLYCAIGKVCYFQSV